MLVQPRHMPALDGLRGVAILLVILTHGAGGWPAAAAIMQDTLAWPGTFHLPGKVANIAGQAIYGVTLFFVVSAFTLTLSLAKGGSLYAYAIRRVARVGPGYWLAGIAYTLVAGLAPRVWAPDGVGISDLIIAAAFGSAWHGGASMAVVPGGWSVSCEIAFYCALPVLLRAIDGRLWRAAGFALLGAGCVQVFAWQAFEHNAWYFIPHYTHPLVQAPVFLCGVTAALLFQRITLPRMPGAPLVLLALAVCAVPFSPVAEQHALHYLMFAVLAAGTVTLSAAHPPKLLAWSLLRHVGEVSYSMYLLHFALLAPSLWLAERVAPGDGMATFMLHFGVTAGVSFGLACLTYRYVEQPGIAFGAALIAKRRLATSDHARSDLVPLGRVQRLAASNDTSLGSIDDKPA